ncbi:MAG: histidinol-phosphate transaminase [Actinobacteria bacterium]|nr:histidinol-phosphate transaminase [Actinomycetota bacterium]
MAKPGRARGMLVSARADLCQLEGYHSPQIEVAVRLNTNESPYPPPERWRDELLEALSSVQLHRYPDRDATALREAIGDLHGVGPEQIFCANGSNEVIQSLDLAYGGPGRSVALFEPTYAMHRHIAVNTSSAVATGRRQEDFSLDLSEIARVARESQPALTFLCSPNNPTGNADSLAEIQEAAAVVPGLLVVDEAYGQFAPRSALPLVAAGSPLVVLRTFSKTWALAGLRLGYLVGPAEVVKSLERVALPYHLDAVKQVAGKLALSYSAEMQERVSLIAEQRDKLMAALDELPVRYWHSDANFILFRPERVEGHKVWEMLLDRSVLIRDCSSWPGLQGCLRVTVGTPDENSVFLNALEDCIL